MLRKLLSVFGGVFLGIITTRAIHSFSTKIHPAPSIAELATEETFKAYLDTLPIEVYYLIIVSHIAGTGIAAFVTSKMNETNGFYLGLISVFVMILFSVITFTQVPVSGWLIAIDLMSMLMIGVLVAKLGD